MNFPFGGSITDEQIKKLSSLFHVMLLVNSKLNDTTLQDVSHFLYYIIHNIYTLMTQTKIF